MTKRIIIFVICICIFMSTGAFAKDISSLEEETFSYIINTVTEPQNAQVGGEWSVIGVARSGREKDSAYFEAYYKNLIKKLEKNNGILHERKYTEYARAVLALSAIGKDPYNADGYNLISYLTDFDKVVFQGTNGAVYALLALDSKGYEKGNEIRERYVSYILSKQQENGGFSLGNGEADIDVTAMCLTALSKYKEDENVNLAIKKALLYLSENQNEDGGFANFDAENSESVFQVIMCLCELGEDIYGEKFIKNSNSLIDNLFSWQAKDGGFYHTRGDKKSNLMATEQAYYTLVNLKRISEGKNSLFNMSDVESFHAEATGKEKEYKIPEFLYKKTFDDISYSKNKEAIENLAGRGILNGKAENLFFPDDKVTRAEFSAIIVRALGLFGGEEIIFSDVKKEDWFYNSVSVAFQKKLINGTSETIFNPHSFITKEEAAAILARTFEILGLNAEMEDIAVRNVLAQFEDYLTCDEWAKKPLALLYDNNILSQDDILIEPLKEVTRGEIADMIARLINEVE